jgi:hypothetical protein
LTNADLSDLPKRKHAKPSRPDDPKVVERAREGARLGLTYTLLASYCGIARSSLFDWLKRGRLGEADCVEFAKAIDEGEGDGAAEMLGIIAAAARERQWQAAAWILERRHGYRRDADPIVPTTEEQIRSPEEAVKRLAASVPASLLRAALAAAEGSGE